MMIGLDWIGLHNNTAKSTRSELKLIVDQIIRYCVYITLRILGHWVDPLNYALRPVVMVQ